MPPKMRQTLAGAAATLLLVLNLSVAQENVAPDVDLSAQEKQAGEQSNRTMSFGIKGMSPTRFVSELLLGCSSYLVSMHTRPTISSTVAVKMTCLGEFS